MKNITLRLPAVVLAIALLANVGESQMRSNKLGVGVSGSYFLTQLDYATSDLSIGGGVEVTYSIMEYMSIRSSLGAGLLEASDPVLSSLSTTLVYANLYLAADFSPNGAFNPFIFVGGSGMYMDPRSGGGGALTGAGVKRTKGTVVGGIGFDIFASEFFSFTVAGEMGLPFTDILDGISSGTEKDAFQRISLSIRYYFFDQDFITRMLKAIEERYK